MSEHDFKPGESVEMKSGGPTMSYVGDHDLPGMAICEWNDGKKRVTDNFHYTSLQKAKPKSGQIKMTRG